MKNLKNAGTKYKNKKKLSNVDRLYTIPIMLIMGVLPFIVRYMEYNPKLATFFWFGGSKAVEDIFLIWKQIFLIVVSSILLVILIYKYKEYKQEKLPNYMYLLVGYNLLIIISTIFSPYRYWGFVGVYEHFESALAHISYFIIVLFCIVFIKKQEQINNIIKFFLGSLCFMVILGFFQGIKLDVLTSKFGTFFIFPYDIWSNLESFTMGFSKGVAYLTLYNPNYVGVYLAMAIPILVAMFFYFKNKFVKLGVIVIIGMAIFSLVQSGSDAGMITVIVCSVITILFLTRPLFRNRTLFYILLCMGIVSIFFVGVQNKDKIESIFMGYEQNTKLQRIETKEELWITYEEQTLQVYYEIEDGEYLFLFLDEYYNLVDYDYNEEEGYYSFHLPGWEHIRMQTGLFNDMYSLLFRIRNVEWYFTNQTGDGSFYYINDNRKLVKIEEAERFFDKKYDTFVTGRGYIWSKTIPLLKKNIVLGSGAESFMFVFPHADYVDLYNSKYSGTIINKPHNMYLQIGVQSGVVSLLFFLVFFIIYLKNGLKLYWNSSIKEWHCKIGFALFLSVLSYLLVSLTNDSFIAVTPVFWCIVGLSLCANRMNSERIES